MFTPKARKTLEKFLYKAAKNHGVLPRQFCLQDVKKEGEHPFGCGSFGDVYKGRINEQKVAVKVCRFFWEPQMKEEGYRVRYFFYAIVPNDPMMYLYGRGQEICKEAFIWKPLDHPNVLPFLGICKDSFPSVGLVSPFMDNGNLMSYMKRVPSIDKPGIVSTCESAKSRSPLTLPAGKGRANLFGSRLPTYQKTRGSSRRPQMREHSAMHHPFGLPPTRNLLQN